jgi:hypothetical protein
MKTLILILLFSPLFSYCQIKYNYDASGNRTNASSNKNNNDFSNHHFSDFNNPLNESDKILIFPNPVSDNLIVRIENDNLSNKFEVSIYDVTGKLVLNTKAIQEATIDVSKLDWGIYFVTATSDKKIKHLKIIKN